MTGKSQREPAGFAPASPPAAVPRPQEWHGKQTAWFLKPEGLGDVGVIFFHFTWFLLHPFRAPFVAVSGSEAQLGPKAPLQKLLPFAPGSVWAYKTPFFRLSSSRRGFAGAVPWGSRAPRCKGGSAWLLLRVAVLSASLQIPSQGRRDPREVFHMYIKQNFKPRDCSKSN